MTAGGPTVENADVVTVDLADEGSGDDGSLSPIYRAALRCEEEGLSHGEIAILLEVEVESVPLLIDLGRRKANRRNTAKHSKG